MSHHKEMKELLKRGHRMGWQITMTGKGHYKWIHPHGGLFYTASSPSDWRAVIKIERDMSKTYSNESRGR